VKEKIAKWLWDNFVEIHYTPPKYFTDYTGRAVIMGDITISPMGGFRIGAFQGVNTGGKRIAIRVYEFKKKARKK